MFFSLPVQRKERKETTCPRINPCPRAVTPPDGDRGIRNGTDNFNMTVIPDRPELPAWPRSCIRPAPSRSGISQGGWKPRRKTVSVGPPCTPPPEGLGMSSRNRWKTRRRLQRFSERTRLTGSFAAWEAAHFLPTSLGDQRSGSHRKM